MLFCGPGGPAGAGCLGRISPAGARARVGWSLNYILPNMPWKAGMEEKAIRPSLDEIVQFREGDI